MDLYIVTFYNCASHFIFSKREGGGGGGEEGINSLNLLISTISLSITYIVFSILGKKKKKKRKQDNASVDQELDSFGKSHLF